MKWIAFALLAVNIALGGYFYWSDSQAETLAGQYSPLNANKIVMQGARMVGDEPAGNGKAGSSISDPICVEWRGMTEAELPRTRELVKRLASRRVLSVEELPIDRMYWVLFPPLPSEAAAKIKLKELTELKIKEAFVIKEAPWNNGLSLGLYGTEDAARRYVKELESKGFSGARIESKAKKDSNYYYVVKTEDAVTLRELDEMRIGFPSTTLIRVACKK